MRISFPDLITQLVALNEAIRFQTSSIKEIGASKRLGEACHCGGQRYWERLQSVQKLQQELEQKVHRIEERDQRCNNVPARRETRVPVPKSSQRFTKEVEEVQEDMGFELPKGVNPPEIPLYGQPPLEYRGRNTGVVRVDELRHGRDRRF